MKPIVIAIVLAVLAGCAQQPFAARGGTVAPEDGSTTRSAYPYNAPYGT